MVCERTAAAEDERESYFMTNMDHILHNSVTLYKKHPGCSSAAEEENLIHAHGQKSKIVTEEVANRRPVCHTRNG